MKLKRDVLLRFVKSYILVLLLPLVIGFLTYYQGVTIIREDTYSIFRSMLSQVIQGIEQDLAEMETLSMQIANNPVLLEQVYQSDVNSNTILQMELCIREVKKYFVNDTSVFDCFIYFENSDYIMTRETLYRTPLYYEYVLHYKSDQYEKWLATLTEKRVPGEYVNIDNFYNGNAHESPYIAFMTSIPFNKGKTVQASLVMIYDKRDIAKALQAMDSNDDSALYYVIDEQGEPLVMSPSPGIMSEWKDQATDNGFTEVEGEMISIRQQGRNGWTYGYMKQESRVFQRLRSYRMIFVAVAVLGIFVSIVLLLVISYRNSKPVYQLMEHLSEYIPDRSFPRETNAYTIIEQGINKLIDSREHLKTDIERQIPMVKAAFIQNILRGLLYSEEDALMQAKLLDIPPRLTNGLFQVVLFRLIDSEDNHGEQLYLTRKTFANYVEGNLDDVYFIHHQDYRTIAVTLHFSDASKMKEHLKQFAEEASKHTALYTGVGDPYGKITEIWYSFDQAQIMINLSAVETRPLLFYADRSEYSDQMYYSVTVEQNLVAYISNGEWKGANQLLETLYNENYKKRLLSPHASSSLMEQLKGSLLRIVNNQPDQHLAEILDSIVPPIQPEPAFRFFKQASKHIITTQQVDKTSKGDSLSEEIRNYITENYMVSILNLSMAASHFNLSEGYFSMIFKKNIGIPFTDYVENVRIQKAMILLTDTTLTISEIAMLCGYNNPQSFRRAFKRIIGCSPSDLRR